MKTSDIDINETVIDPEIESEILEAISPVQPPAQLRAKVLDRIAATRRPDSDLMTIRDKESWKEMAPGIEFKLLTVDQQAHTKSFLLRAQSGSCMPAHDHHGHEECLVLEGTFNIGELTLVAGDFHCAKNGTSHEHSSTDTGVVVFLKASIEDYPEVRL